MTDILGAMGTAIYSKLAAGTALTTALGGTLIYSEQAPDGSSLPYVIFNHQAGGPENVVGSDDLRNHVWFIRAYASTRGSANVYDGKVSDLLHRGSLSVSGWTNFLLVREQDFALVENLPNGNKIYMAGGTYRIRLSA